MSSIKHFVNTILNKKLFCLFCCVLKVIPNFRFSAPKCHITINCWSLWTLDVTCCPISAKFTCMSHNLQLYVIYVRNILKHASDLNTNDYVCDNCQTISSCLNGKFLARIICSLTSLTTLPCFIENFKSDPAFECFYSTHILKASTVRITGYY